MGVSSCGCGCDGDAPSEQNNACVLLDLSVRGRPLSCTHATCISEIAISEIHRSNPMMRMRVCHHDFVRARRLACERARMLNASGLNACICSYTHRAVCAAKAAQRL